MINYGFKVLIILFSILTLYSCNDDENLVTNERSGIYYYTPMGDEVKPAEDGPERSAYGVPEIDLDQYQLEITGLVDSSFSLKWNEVQNWEAAYTDTIMMYCVEGWEVWGNWKGIQVDKLLDVAKVKLDGEYILVESAEGFKSLFSLSYLIKYNLSSRVCFAISCNIALHLNHRLFDFLPILSRTFRVWKKLSL